MRRIKLSKNYFSLNFICSNFDEPRYCFLFKLYLFLISERFQAIYKICFSRSFLWFAFVPVIRAYEFKSVIKSGL